ncbi:myelin-oligodendrocyte glycoprotein isoform X9 [Chelonia mydas]|uniref:myelin-oligodendrocyte glycoprotein isoform X9 n=1 Tax=Chelonia mydas TaxID=8469 RepID=UPI001CA8942F|nr:myelin-oligodendrocyte glycoprotein isoform X9 [Chelonia mydas]
MELQGQLSSRLFCAILLAVIPFSESFEVISSPTVTGIVGQDVVLPCQVSTGMQPAKMEVQWKKIIPAARETVHEYRAQPGQDVPGPNYQGRTMLLKDGFTLGNVSLKLKNVRPADRGMYSCIVKSNEWSADAATELQIAETSEEKTEKMAEALVVLVVVLIVIIIIGIIFIYYYLRNRRRDPEKGTLISAEQVSGHRVGWSQNQGRIQEERGYFPLTSFAWRMSSCVIFGGQEL